MLFSGSPEGLKSSLEECKRELNQLDQLPHSLNKDSRTRELRREINFLQGFSIPVAEDDVDIAIKWIEDNNDDDL